MKTIVGFPDDDDETNQRKRQNDMPKLNFGIADAADVEAAQGFKPYKGKLPPNGAYEGVLKVLKVGKIGSGTDKGKHKLSPTVILDDPEYPEYHGCPMFGNLNLTDQGVPYVNQFLESLTDGSEKAKADIKRAFWKTGPIVDDAKEHILRIGKLQVNSPKGEIRVLVGTKIDTYNGNTSVKIQQYMLIGDDEDRGPNTDDDDDDDESNVVEAEDDSDDVTEVDSDDEDAGEDEDPYADDEGDGDSE